ncbi:MAG: S46 family peptidase, partial [Myxococcales bacterium]|nr:S46 family peptidase [Myxococcales bacterium]
MLKRLPAILLSLSACSHGTPPAPPAPDPAPSAPAPLTDFENPGGMWMPSQLADQADTLKRLGLALPPEALTDPMAHPLGAVVYLGGCSASFVSPEGLIITNHHCAQGALQLNSTPEDNILEKGFVAKTRAEERSNGPSERVFVTQKFTDVTARVRAGLEAEKDDNARHDLVEAREKAIVSECEEGRPDIRCSVVSYFGSETMTLVEQLEIRDLRLVYAPPEGVGNFGGEIDNWRWPRHAGDFTFFRAYVDKDGKPADYSPDNVPYRPRHHLQIADQPLEQGDLVFVAGYPAMTSRLRTADEVKETVEWYYPRVVQLTDDYIALLEKLSQKSEALAIKSGRLLRGLNNWRTNTKGMLDGLVKGGLEEQKAEQEKALLAWAAQQPEHAEAAAALARLGEDYRKYRGERDADAANQEAVRFNFLLRAARTIVKMAEERPKPDAERDPAYQARNHRDIEQEQAARQKTYDPELDRALLELAVARAARVEPRPAVIDLVVGKGEPATPEAIAAAVARLYAGTTLDKLDTRLRLLREATTAELTRSRDPLIQLALALHPVLEAIDRRDEGYVGALYLDRPVFARALRAFVGGKLAPDANRTLRVTYGTVRGYR